jgi:hypothetical protein
MDDLLFLFVFIASVIRNRHHAFRSPDGRTATLALALASADGGKVTPHEEPFADRVKPKSLYPCIHSAVKPSAKPPGRQNRTLAGACAIRRAARAPGERDTQLPDALAQGIAVDPEQFGGLDLIPARAPEDER